MLTKFFVCALGALLTTPVALAGLVGFLSIFPQDSDNTFVAFALVAALIGPSLGWFFVWQHARDKKAERERVARVAPYTKLFDMLATERANFVACNTFTKAAGNLFEVHHTISPSLHLTLHSEVMHDTSSNTFTLGVAVSLSTKPHGEDFFTLVWGNPNNDRFDLTFNACRARLDTPVDRAMFVVTVLPALAAAMAAMKGAPEIAPVLLQKAAPSTVPSGSLQIALRQMMTLTAACKAETGATWYHAVLTEVNTDARRLIDILARDPQVEASLTALADHVLPRLADGLRRAVFYAKSDSQNVPDLKDVLYVLVAQLHAATAAADQSALKALTGDLRRAAEVTRLENGLLRAPMVHAPA